MDNLTGSIKDAAFATNPREFDLSYCLSELPKEFVQMESILIHKLDEVITLLDSAGGSIKMNDFKIEVRR